MYQTEADTIGLQVGWGIGHVVDGVAILELPDSAGVSLKAIWRSLNPFDLIASLGERVICVTLLFPNEL